MLNKSCSNINFNTNFIDKNIRHFKWILNTNLIYGDKITLLHLHGRSVNISRVLWSTSSLVNCYIISVSQMTMDMFLLSWTQSRPSTLLFTYSLYQVRVIMVFTVVRLLTDFVCLYTYEFWLSLCKMDRSSVILLLPLFIDDFVLLTIVSLFVLFFLCFLISINGLCLLRWYLQTSHWQPTTERKLLNN